MNTIIFIILTLIFLACIVLGLIFFRVGLSLGSFIGITLFVIGLLGIIYLGTTMISNDIYIKETVCSYTVGKSDEICMDVYNINFYYSFPSTSDKIGLTYLIFGMGSCILMFREFLLLLWHFNMSSDL